MLARVPWSMYWVNSRWNKAWNKEDRGLCPLHVSGQGLALSPASAKEQALRFTLRSIPEFTTSHLVTSRPPNFSQCRFLHLLSPNDNKEFRRVDDSINFTSMVAGIPKRGMAVTQEHLGSAVGWLFAQQHKFTYIRSSFKTLLVPCQFLYMCRDPTWNAWKGLTYNEHKDLLTTSQWKNAHFCNGLLGLCTFLSWRSTSLLLCKH